MSAVGAGPILAAAIAPIAGKSTDLAHAVNASADVTDLPPGFPAELKSELAWTGADFDNTTEHILILTDAHKAEIKAAVEAYKCESQLLALIWLPMASIIPGINTST